MKAIDIELLREKKAITILDKKDIDIKIRISEK